MVSFLRKNALLLIIVPLGILCVATSYFRFVILNDYLVGYEVECDPATQVCSVGCEDDTCVSTYYYYHVEKLATLLQQQCGTSIEGCASASECLPEDSGHCVVTFCNPDTEDCYTEMAQSKDIP